jgi:peptide/nickel transport system substrate-binding protein
MDERDNYWTRVATRRLSRRRIVVLAGTGAAAAAVLAACGDDDDDDRPAGGGGSTAPGAEGAPGSYTKLPVGKFGGRAKVVVALETGTLDAHTPGSGGDAPYLNAIYNSLVGFDQEGTGLRASAPVSLAEKWEVPDPTTIVFTLKKDIKFHDGTPFDSTAVKYNVSRILDPDLKATWASQLASVDRVETPDALTARFVLKKPDAALMFALSSVYGAGMVSPTAVEKSGRDFKSNPVGTGPYLFDRWVPGSHVSFKRNPNYWEKNSEGKALPYLDQLEIHAIPDETVRFANLQTGEADLGAVGSKDIPAAERHGDLKVIKGVPGAGVAALLHYNIAIAPMDNPNLRKAIAFAIDPKVVNKNVYFDLAIPAEGAMTTPGTWAYSPVKGRPTYDPEKAKEFLRAGGQPDGFSMDVITYTAPNINQQTEIYQDFWAKIGIKAQITTQEVSTAVTTFFGPGRQTFPLMSTSWGGTSPEPSTTPTIAWKKDSFYNPAKQPLDPRLDGLLDQARETYDEEQRKKLYQEIEQIVVAEQCAFVPLLYTLPRWTVRKSVGNAESFYWPGLNRLQYIFVNA